MIFELFEMPRFPVPYPCNSLGVLSTKDLINRYGFTIDEVDRALDGKVIRERFFIDFSQSFQRKRMIDDLAYEYPDGLPEDEIALILNEKYDNVRQIFCRAKAKMVKEGTFKQFLCNVRKLRDLRSKRDKYEFAFNGTLTVEVN